MVPSMGIMLRMTPPRTAPSMVPIRPYRETPLVFMVIRVIAHSNISPRSASEKRIAIVVIGIVMFHMIASNMSAPSATRNVPPIPMSDSPTPVSENMISAARAIVSCIMALGLFSLLKKVAAKA